MNRIIPFFSAVVLFGILTSTGWSQTDIGQQQVMLDTQIMEVDRTRLRGLGIDWAGFDSSARSKFVAPLLTFPLSEDPEIGTVGGGFTCGCDWTRWAGDGARIGPVLSGDLTFSGFNPDARLFMPSDPFVDYEGKGVLNMFFRPGIRIRTPLTPQCQFVGDFGGVFGAKFSGTRETGPGPLPVPADSIETSAPVVGWFVGLGFEIPTPNGNSLLTTIQYRSYLTDFLTGRDRQEGDLAILAEIPFLRPQFRSDRRRYMRNNLQLQVTPQINNRDDIDEE